MSHVGSVDRAKRFAVPAAILALLLAGCSTQDQSAVPGEDPRISEIRAMTTSDFEREVLADGMISDQEFQASRELFKTCMEGRGYGIGLGPIDNATTTIELKDPTMTVDLMDKDSAECSTGTTYFIEPTFSIIRENPDNEDTVQLLIDCLIRNELVSEAFTKDDFAVDSNVDRKSVV